MEVKTDFPVLSPPKSCPSFCYGGSFIIPYKQQTNSCFHLLDNDMVKGKSAMPKTAQICRPLLVKIQKKSGETPPCSLNPQSTIVGPTLSLWLSRYLPIPVGDLPIWGA